MGFATAHLMKRTERWDERRKATAEETYVEVKDLIYHTVWRIVKKYGGHFDDMVSEANVAFIEAYDTFDGRIPFSAWVRQLVTYELVDNVRARCVEHARYESVEDCDIARPSHNWKVEDVLEGLSEDATTVIKLVVDTPQELAEIVAGKGGQPRNFRSTVRSYLDGIGWTAKRVAETFFEIQRVLAD